MEYACSDRQQRTQRSVWVKFLKRKFPASQRCNIMTVRFGFLFDEIAMAPIRSHTVDHAKLPRLSRTHARMEEALYGRISHSLVTSLVQRAGVKLQSDDGEYDDGEQHQQPDLEQRCHSLDDGLQHDLQTYTGGGGEKKNNVYYVRHLENLYSPPPSCPIIADDNVCAPYTVRVGDTRSARYTRGAKVVARRRTRPFLPVGRNNTRYPYTSGAGDGSGLFEKPRRAAATCRSCVRVLLTWNAGDQLERPQHPDRSQRSQVHVCR